jgi:chemotaxis protein MotB
VEKSARPIIIVRRKVSHAGHHGGAWKVAYADFVTAMMALFIVLWLLNSTSQVDKKKVGHLALAIQVAFQELGVFPASDTKVPRDATDPMLFSAVQTIETTQRVATMGRIVDPPTGSLSGAEENGDLSSLQRELRRALAPEIRRKEVALRAVPDGLVISLREIGFFESGSADIKSSSQEAFGRITSLLAQRSFRIRIEGHTDNVPIHNSRFDSNWELSTARATPTRSPADDQIQIRAGAAGGRRLCRVPPG